MKSCDFTIYDMIVRNAELYGDKCALVCGDVRLSFSEYKSLCDCCAAGLIREGISIGDRIAVLSGNCEDFMILCGAAAKVGAIVVAINYRLSAGELTYIFQDTTPKYLFSSNEFREQAGQAAAGSVKKHFVFKPEPGAGDFVAFDSLFLQDRGAQADPVDPGDAFMIIHTAAVGGHPRGCVLSQTNMLSVGLQMAQMFGLSEKDCHICMLPLFHIGGFSMSLAVMHQGGKNAILPRFDPVLILEAIEKEQGTFFGSFPPMLGAILDALDKQTCNISSLRGVGGIDAPNTIQRFLKASPQSVFYSLYGQTEAMPVSSCNVMERPGSIGRPGIMTRVAIFDDLDREVPAGVQGEICVRSSSVFLGYWNLETDSAYVSRNGWHHTGDLGRLDEDGYLWYAGRKPEKELIKPGGENVYPLEVEKAILGHDAIEEVSVIGVPDPEWGEAVKAVCVLKKGMQVSAEDLITFVGSRIARYKKPKHVLFVERLPKSADGAINREEVKKNYSGNN